MKLTIRAYNVLFGDCILVSWDEQDGPHHAWIDFGNMGNDANSMFATIYDDVLLRTGGRLDLVLITHRHLDHLEGFHSLGARFKTDYKIDRLWHAFVRPELDSVFELADEQMKRLLPLETLAGKGDIGRIYRNNHFIATRTRMSDILDTLPAQSAHQVYRTMNLKAAGALPPGMRRMKVEVLGPERDSRRYLRPLADGLRARQALADCFESLPLGASVDAGAFEDAADDAEFVFVPPVADFSRLRRQLKTSGLDLLAAVDTTRNNTSVVTRWTYNKRISFLLTGDAELMSWHIMRQNKAKLAANLVKVGHHGSVNASPSWSFAEVFPAQAAINAALISTDRDRFTGENEVPNEAVLSGWSERLLAPDRLRRTDALDVPAGSSVAFDFTL